MTISLVSTQTWIISLIGWVKLIVDIKWVKRDWFCYHRITSLLKTLVLKLYNFLRGIMWNSLINNILLRIAFEKVHNVAYRFTWVWLLCQLESPHKRLKRVSTTLNNEKQTLFLFSLFMFDNDLENGFCVGSFSPIFLITNNKKTSRTLIQLSNCLTTKQL